jgi:hypothetical protein
VRKLEEELLVGRARVIVKRIDPGGMLLDDEKQLAGILGIGQCHGAVET